MFYIWHYFSSFFNPLTGQMTRNLKEGDAEKAYFKQQYINMQGNFRSSPHVKQEGNETWKNISGCNGIWKHGTDIGWQMDIYTLPSATQPFNLWYMEYKLHKNI